ncbi:hypothetical protein [Nesterenkonia sp. PF2B19]|uniref:hypothetical protein n=1 Tax=unclassified Nesterenkonia TaxID=2629769 RepID=UPI00087215AD|nr:hypothetical protein [Nesterenkonia sp. PF2B19]OSM43843.1 hypothetical protein BCY76_005920 [Nesterenkonia sp. PF2B19]
MERHDSGGPRGGLALTLRWLFSAVVILHALMVLAQPFLAGGSLDGHAVPLLAHAAVGGTLILVSMVLVVLGVLAWMPGGGSAWAPVMALGLVILEIAQVALGHLHLLSIHVPLGVVITLLAAGLCLVALRRPRPRSRRTRTTLPARHDVDPVSHPLARPVPTGGPHG